MIVYKNVHDIPVDGATFVGGSHVQPVNQSRMRRLQLIESLVDFLPGVVGGVPVVSAETHRGLAFVFDVRGDVMDVSRTPRVFDGRRLHAVTPFSGTRISLVLFTPDVEVPALLRN